VNKTAEFTKNAIEQSRAMEKKANGNGSDANGKEWEDVDTDALSKEEGKTMKMITNVFKDFFTADEFNGYVASLERGSLGLTKIVEAKEVEAGNSGNIDAVPAKMVAVGSA